MKHLLAAMGAALALLASGNFAAAQQCCTGNVSTYCTSGTSVQGCVPSISGSGIPSVDAGSGFVLRIAQIPGQRSGLIFYGTTAAAASWAPGSSSTLCINAPVIRTSIQDSGGLVGGCAGLFALDFNAYIAANPGGSGTPFFAGQQLLAQGWYRDPGAAAQTNLSNALQFALCLGNGDTLAPTITTCAASQTVSANAGCLGVVPNFTSGVVAADNCSAVTVTQTPVAGTSVPLGVHPITITATDGTNVALCRTTLTVVDTTPPVILSCAPDQSVFADAACQAIVPDLRGTVIATDACSVPTISQSPTVGSAVGVGTTSVLLTASDAAGNSTTCVATLRVLNSLACPPTGYVAIQPGIFQIGSSAPLGPPYFGDYGNCQPPHGVTITYPYLMGTHEVTQAQYLALMGSNPSFHQGNNQRPVEQVSWSMARAYCAALTAQQATILPAGYEFRLPTEAEWEYACRAGTTTEYNVGAILDCSQARFSYSFHSSASCASTGPAVVGSFPPNAWGLHDMHGNVWEWCLDSFAPYVSGAQQDPFVTGGSQRVMRGGRWDYSSAHCRSAYRVPYDPSFALNSFGFRVVLAPIRVP